MRQFSDINEQLNFFYGGSMGEVAKADAPILSSTTGVFNAVYGAMAFLQTNLESNAWAVLPKYPWQHSGYRAITADAGSSADGGLSEGAVAPETIKPTFAQIDVPVKEVSHTFQVSYRMDGLFQSGDDVFGSMEQLQKYMANIHAKRLNQQLLLDGDTLASTRLESIDRVTASAAYATAIGWTANDEDIYGIDRSAASWSDAVVSHNSGVDRTLALDLIEDTLASLEDAGAKTNVIITGNDTKWRIIGLAQTQVRYQGVVETNVLVKIGLNGVDTEEGIGFGLRVATVYNIPMFSSVDVPKDTISRIYLLDTTMADVGIPKLGIALLYPTLFFASGMNAADRNPFITGFTTKGGYYTSAELVCTVLAHQGSVRDLK